MKKAVVIGMGSIGQRHGHVLSTLGYDVVAVSKRRDLTMETYDSIDECLSVHDPQLVIISNETHRHQMALSQVSAAGFTGHLLIEKPLFHHFKDCDAVTINDELKGNIVVGYNLRFHTLTEKLRDVAMAQEVLLATFYCGSYLPDWRPHQPDPSRYSCERELGGGVIRDLSHELDLALYLLGPRTGELRAMTSGHGHLGKDVEEATSILMNCERCPHVNISLNYWDRAHRREATLVTKNGTYRADYRSGQLFCDHEMILQVQDERNDMYKKQVLEFEQGHDKACTFAQGMDVLQLIEDIERKALGDRK